VHDWNQTITVGGGGGGGETVHRAHLCRRKKERKKEGKQRSGFRRLHSFILRSVVEARGRRKQLGLTWWMAETEDLVVTDPNAGQTCDLCGKESLSCNPASEGHGVHPQLWAWKGVDRRKSYSAKSV
jgi:hypothetical protein